MGRCIESMCINICKGARQSRDLLCCIYTQFKGVCACIQLIAYIILQYKHNHLQYVLSSGRDSNVKLWELAAGGRCLIAYTGAGSATGIGQEFNIHSVFNHTEDYGCYLCDLLNTSLFYSYATGREVGQFVFVGIS
jgi:hypothetical protein